ncbi:MAG: hypothetical protein IKG91_01990, partial [Firmicutes bacterium]|nr:hypothetical protein [Bacillota bacterium]
RDLPFSDRIAFNTIIHKKDFLSLSRRDSALHFFLRFKDISPQTMQFFFQSFRIIARNFRFATHFAGFLSFFSYKKGKHESHPSF